MDADPTRRFSNRVADYVRYRPRYPAGVLEFFRDSLGLQPSHVVADIGSGTGLFSEIFLANGNQVYGIEPNAEMRQAGEQELAGWKNFVSVNGHAEATTLPAGSADFVVAGQAFHWFRPTETRREFQRILRPGGWVVLVWNDRNDQASAFLAGYAALLDQFCEDHANVQHKHCSATDSARLAVFFAPRQPARTILPGLAQSFDFAGLKGRLLSSSYAPPPGHPLHEAMIAELQHLFDQHQRQGQVLFEYQTQVIYSQLEP